MPSIGERCLAPLSEGTPKPIGIRLTGLEMDLCCGYLPRLALLPPSHELGFGRAALFFVHDLPSDYILSCASASFHGERLRKERFGHAADAACIGFLCWVCQEGVHDVVWTSAGRIYAVPHSWKQEE